MAAHGIVPAHVALSKATQGSAKDERFESVGVLKPTRSNRSDIKTLKGSVDGDQPDQGAGDDSVGTEDSEPFEPLIERRHFDRLPRT